MYESVFKCKNEYTTVPTHKEKEITFHKSNEQITCHVSFITFFVEMYFFSFVTLFSIFISNLFLEIKIFDIFYQREKSLFIFSSLITYFLTDPAALSVDIQIIQGINV